MMIVLVLFVSFVRLLPYFGSDDYIYMLDVGQGDCMLVHIDNKNILIDTGGQFQYGASNKYSIMRNELIPFFKSIGIYKIDLLVLTHGDYDHAGEAIELLNNFSVEQVMFNMNDFNDLESRIVDLLEEKSIGYFKINSFLNLSFSNYALYFFCYDLDDENDSSIMTMIVSSTSKVLLMGDASIKTESLLLEDYGLGNVDVLKLGHHGSYTSSSEYFLSNINPNVALISVSLDNNFNHPHIIVMDRLKQYDIETYLTSIDGSVKYSFQDSSFQFSGR